MTNSGTGTLVGVLLVVALLGGFIAAAIASLASCPCPRSSCWARSSR